MSEEKNIEKQQMDSDSEDYDDETNYENIKQEGESNNGTIGSTPMITLTRATMR